MLASASPRRRELLERLGLHVLVAPVDIDETPRPAEPARDYARRLANEKCAQAVERGRAARADSGPSLPVLAADTTVVVDDAVLGKPVDAADAAAMLRRLAGRRHEVITAYAIAHGERTVGRAISTQVTFRLLDDREIAAYLASEEWRDKAGGYAIQGRAALFVTELRGSPTNVIGLPLAEVIADLLALQALPHYPPAGFGVSREPG